jgi:hypothetical protein
VHLSLFSMDIVKGEAKSDGRFGVVVGIPAFYVRGRGFDSRTVQTFVCMNMSVCIGSGRFLCIVFLCKVYVFIKKKLY